jgi:hypothetical protein
MVPFRASLPGRIVWLSVAFALVSGGLIPIFGVNPAVWIPFALLIPVFGCVVGTILSIHEHHWAAMALAVALPLCLWPYTMVLMLLTKSWPQFGWLFIAAGGAMTMLGAAGLVRRPVPTPQQKPSLA